MVWCAAYFLLLLLLSVVAPADMADATHLTRPRPDCRHTTLNVTAQQLSLYDVAFDDFEEMTNRSGWQTLTFDSLAFLGTVAGGGADLAEMLVTLRRIARAVAPASVSIEDVRYTWQEAWSALATTLAAEAQSHMDEGDVSGAASAWLRSATYMQLALRFSDHRTEILLYSQSVAWFNQALKLAVPAMVACAPVDIPFEDTRLFAYWCPAAAPNATSTVVAVTGYDASNLNSYFEVGVPAVHRGLNVLLLEGPGQGMTVRQHKLYFRPNWGTVVDAAVSWLAQNATGLSLDMSRIVLWGRSMGGYLAPQGFATASVRPAALVADGGIENFFQTTYCSLHADLRDLLYTDAATFDRYLLKGMDASLSLRSLLLFGFLGFNTSSPSNLFFQWQNYDMGPHMASLAAYPVLVNAPAWDTLVGNSSRIFWAQLAPTHPQSVLLALDPLRGTGLHCDVGSTASTINRILAWVTEVSGQGLAQNKRRT